jgi:hypothetical protein
MSTVKITDLPVISNLDANTGNTILVGVDLSSDVTGRISATVLADGLYENKALKVGAPDIIFSNVIAQFAGSGDPYLQINAQNIDANNSMDYVATADIGTDANNYIDMGINNSQFVDEEFSAQSALDGYLYVHGSVNSSSDGNLIIGTASAGANVVFAVGGQRSANVVATLSRFGLTMNGASYIKFSDNSIQSVAAAPAALSQGAYDTANSASANSIITQGVDAWQNTQITAVNQYAQSGFATANDANSMAVGAYDTANGANGLAGYAANTANGANGLAAGAFNTANGANGLAAGAYNTANGANGLAGYAANTANAAVANTSSITLNNSLFVPGTLAINGTIYANGATYVANAMSIPTTYSTPQTNITLNYQAANIVKTNITSDLVVAHSNIVLGKYIDLFVYNDSAITQTITHGVSANNSSTKGTTTKVQPYATKHLKYFTVDSDLANTYVIESISENYNNEDVYFAGDLTMNGTVILANSNFAATEAAFRITAAGSSQTPTQAGTLMQLTSKPNTPARVLIDSFGTSNTAYSIIAGRSARGTVDTPTPTQNNDILLRIAGNSYGTTGYAPLGVGRIDFVATENHSDTNRGSKIVFYNTPNGSNVVNQIATFNADSVTFTGTVAPQKGFIYSPNVVTTGATTLTIDFTRDSLIKANSNGGLTVSFTNYVYGKEVIVWFTNTGGSTQTVTHGCLANNSTVGATSFSMSAGSTAMLRYFSIDGSLGDTFVAVTN